MHPPAGSGLRLGPTAAEQGDGRIPLGIFFPFFFLIDRFLKNISTAQDSTTHPKCVAIYILRKLYSNHM